MMMTSKNKDQTRKQTQLITAAKVNPIIFADLVILIEEQRKIMSIYERRLIFLEQKLEDYHRLHEQKELTLNKKIDGTLSPELPALHGRIGANQYHDYNKSEIADPRRAIVSGGVSGYLS